MGEIFKLQPPVPGAKETEDRGDEKVTNSLYVP